MEIHYTARKAFVIAPEDSKHCKIYLLATLASVSILKVYQ